jgi:hypothetical protein
MTGPHTIVQASRAAELCRSIPRRRGGLKSRECMRERACTRQIASAKIPSNFVRARLGQLVILAGVLNLSAVAQGTVADAGKKPVRLLSIHVKGSRLPEQSVIRLAGLEVGQVIDEARLRKALQSASASGLFSNIAYSYESAPGTTDVSLELVVTDQLPTVPATINVEHIDSEKVWEYLVHADPLFTRELPPTEAPLRSTSAISTSTFRVRAAWRLR